MNILVTGGGGYIGTHVSLEALNQGHNVIVLDNFSSSYQKYIKKIKILTSWQKNFWLKKNK